MPIRKTGSLPENIDRQVNEIIRAYHEVEEKVNRLQNTLDSQIRSNVESIRQHTLNKSNPHFVTAQQIRALPLEFILDSSAVYFPFYQSLVSTRGIEPDGLQEATKTEYGLVTGDGLCATLLPEGGVAVTEGTENLFPVETQDFETNWTAMEGVQVTVTQNISVPEWRTNKATRIQISGGAEQTKYYISLGILPLGEIRSKSIRVKNIGSKTVRVHGNFRIMGDVYPGETKYLKLENIKGTGIGYDTTIFQAINPADSLDFIAHQPTGEKKPYCTPFTEGTRPAGSLSYDLPISINSDWTVAKWMELEPYFMDKSRSGDKPTDKHRLPLIEIGTEYYATGYGVLGVYGAWADNEPGKTIRIMANKDEAVVYSSSPETISLTEAEYNNKLLVVLTKSGPMLTAYIYTVQNKYVLTCDITSLGDISQIAPRLNYHTVTTSNRMYSKRHLNTLVCPYAVSPETVATWHSLDVPFIDPFILLSQ